MATLPWAALRYSIIGCDSNLRTSPFDHPHDTLVHEDGRVFSGLLRRYDLADLWAGSDDVVQYTHYPTQANQSASRIDRIMIPTAFLRQVQDVTVADIELSDHRPVMGSFGELLPNSLPRLPRRVATHLLISDKTLLSRAKDLVAAATATVSAGSSPVHAWSPLLCRIGEECKFAYDALASTILDRRRFNLKRKLRRLRVQIDALIESRRVLTASGGTLPAAESRRLALLRHRRFEAHTRSVTLARLVTLGIAKQGELSRAELTSNSSGVIGKSLHQATDMPHSFLSIYRASHQTYCNKPEDIAAELTRFWSTLRSPAAAALNADTVQARTLVLSCVQRSVQAANLTCDISLDDIKASIRAAKMSAPGIDRTDIVPYKVLDGLAPLLCELWARRHTDGLPSDWRTSLLSLYPKPGAANKQLPGSYRPISVDCVPFRIVCSAIQRRLAVFLDSVINREQRAFVRSFKGDSSFPRSIFDGIAEVFGLAHNATRHMSPLAIVSFDFFKAYDTINRDFIYSVLTAMGCTASFVTDIAFILKDCSSQIVVNGRLGQPFDIRVGVAQGNPLSCFLYIAAVSALPELARRMRVSGYTPVLPLSAAAALPGGVLHPVRCNQYVDNMIAYCSSASDVCLWFETLAVFGRASSQLCVAEATRIVQVASPSIVPLQYAAMVLQGTDAVRVLGVYMNASGGVHCDTWTRRLAVMRERISMLDVTPACQDLRSRATALRSFVTPSLTFAGSVVDIPPAAIGEADAVCRAFLFRGRQAHPRFETVSEDLIDGGLTKHGGAGPLGAVLQSLVARRFLDYVRGRTSPADAWLWHDASVEHLHEHGTTWSPLSAPSWRSTSHTYNPNRYAHVMAARLGLMFMRHSRPLAAKTLQLEPLGGNFLFGSALTARVAGKPCVRIGDIFRQTGTLIDVGRSSQRSSAALYIDQLRAEWPEFGVAVSVPVSTAADFVVGDHVWLCYNDIDFTDATRAMHNEIGQVMHVGVEVSQVGTCNRWWDPVMGPLLTASLGVCSAIATPVQNRRCHKLTLSAGGDRLFRSDELVFDSRLLVLPVSATDDEVSIARCSQRASLEPVDDTITLPTVLRAWRGDRARYMRESDLVTRRDRELLPIDRVETKHLFKRARSLCRSVDSNHHISAKVVSFSDMTVAHWPRRVFDFVWRLLHKHLAFHSWMITAGGVRMTVCPDCHYRLDAVCNDHITLNCTGGVLEDVFTALNTLISPVLARVDQRAALAFKRAWYWCLAPSRRSAWSLVAIWLAAIAKHELWVCFAARMFAGRSSHVGDDGSFSDDLHHLVDRGDAAIRVRTAAEVVDDIKAQFVAALRYMKLKHYKWFRCMAFTVEPILSRTAVGWT